MFFGFCKYKKFFVNIKKQEVSLIKFNHYSFARQFEMPISVAVCDCGCYFGPAWILFVVYRLLLEI